MRSEDTPHPSDDRPRGDGRIWHPEPESATCETCGVRFTPQRGSQGRFCSRACYWTWWRANGQKEASDRGLRKLERLKSEGKDPRTTEEATLKRRMAFRNSALALGEPDDLTDDDAWAKRGAYWQEIADPPEDL